MTKGRKIRIIPNARPEPDLDRIVLALLAMLDQSSERDRTAQEMDVEADEREARAS
jgi:hypothetical protein